MPKIELPPEVASVHRTAPGSVAAPAAGVGAVSPAEAAAYLGVGKSTFYRWAAAGDVHVTKIRGRVLVPVAELARLVAAVQS